ncbi:MAG: N-acetylmuramoyl-L-alanine amidase [Verrucomicrobiota bacterium]
MILEKRRVLWLGLRVDRRRFCSLVSAGISTGTLGLWPLRAYSASGGTYTVRSGDTLSGIAAKFGTSVDAIRFENGITGDLIRVGQVLQLPGDNVLSEVKRVSEPKRGGLRTWRYIVVHHAGVGTGNAQIYDNYHRRRGMRNGLAYHFVIGNGTKSADGEIEIGPRWDRQLHGGHVKSSKVNEQGVGVCLVGNFQSSRPTARQIASLTALTGYLRDLIPNRTKFAVHREIDGKHHTVCPGRYFPTARMHGLFPDEW